MNTRAVRESQTQSVENNRIAQGKKLLVFLTAIIFCFSFFLMVDITSVIAQTSHSDHMDGSLLDSHDMDGDGLSDTLEEDTLGTDKTNKYGDKDSDGLYDFEEYLDYYGTPDDPTDTPKYNYDDDTTHGNLLDIYHYFNLSTYKDGHIRDISAYSAEIAGFTNTLIWNVTFSGDLAGGRDTDAVTYENNLLVDVTFDGQSAGGADSQVVKYLGNTLQNVIFKGKVAGGSRSGAVTYKDNVLEDVIFGGVFAGGSQSGTITYENNTLVNVTFSGGNNAGGSSSGSVTYENNTLVNVTFSGLSAGGSQFNTLTYKNNSLMNVNFSGNGTGGSESRDVIYKDNTLEDVNFSGEHTGGSELAGLMYEDNTLKDVHFSGLSAGGSESGDVIYEDNTLENVTFSGLSAGGNNNTKSNVTYTGNTLTNVTFNERNTGLSANTTGGKTRVAGDTGGYTKYSGNQFSDVQYAGVNQWASLSVISENNVIVSDTYDSDNDSLGDVRELFELDLNPVDGDSDSDTLNDAWEVLYSGADDVNPTVGAASTRLTTDQDVDGLTLSEEEEHNTNPGVNDTDGDGLNDSYEVRIKTSPLIIDSDEDGLNDGWEVLHNDSNHVNPTIKASNIGLRSDQDRDGLILSEEEEHNANPNNRDTDGDGLNDSYEVRISTNVTKVDSDGDGLNDEWEATYNDSEYVNPTVEASSPELDSDEDLDGLTLSEEEDAGSNPSVKDTDGDGLNDSYEVSIGTNPTKVDSDGDGLNDEWEVLYNDSDHVNPTVKASDPELNLDEEFDGLTLAQEGEFGSDPSDIDTDGDGLNDSYEALTLRSNPASNDSDGDGLFDSWEFIYNSSEYVNLIVKADSEALRSDEDNDGLTLAQEGEFSTDPSNSDSDGDGLNDGWEVTYRSSSGVNPLVPATAEELASDNDNDGLTLLQEAEGNTDPETFNKDDNGNGNGTTSTTAATSNAASTSSSQSPAVEGSSFALFVVLTVFLFFSTILAVYRVRRRKYDSQIEYR